MGDETSEELHSDTSTPSGHPRRRWWPVVLVTAVVVALVLTVTAVAGVFGDDKFDETGSDLPSLDPDKSYTFEDLEDGSTSEPTRTSKAYRDAFWGYLEEHFPEHQNHAIVEEEFADPKDLDEAPLGDKVKGADVVRTMSGLAQWRWDNKEKTASTFERNTGYKRPYFQMSGTAANNLPDYTQFPGRKYADGLSLRVYPAGSFGAEFADDAEIPGVQFMDSCKGKTKCDTGTTSDGDKVLTSTVTRFTDDQGEEKIYEQTNTVGFVRASDGVGIVISDQSPINRSESDTDDASGEPAPLDDPDDATPALTLKDLTRLAQALPEKPVT